MRGINLLKDNDISFAIISVVNETHLEKNASELYNFFKSVGPVSIGFNVEEIEGGNKGSALAHGEKLEKLKSFWSELYKVNKSDDFQLKIREVENFTPAEDQIHLQNPIQMALMTTKIKVVLASDRESIMSDYKKN
jgi:sulfatase maturation enzyme AslB (radical SAM superfamily)